MRGGTVFFAHEDLAVEHFVVAEDVVDHFLVEVLGRGLEGDFHAAGFLLLEIDVSSGRGREKDVSEERELGKGRERGEPTGAFG